MHSIILVLLLAGTAMAADWTGAAWQQIFVRDTGEFHSKQMILPCRGDTVYAVAMVQMNVGGSLTWEGFRWTTGLEWESWPLPCPDAHYVRMEYDSVDRRWPAVLGDDVLWRWDGQNWFADTLAEQDSLGLPLHLQDLCFDSAGALHYVLMDGYGQNVLYYRRRHVLADRDTTFAAPPGEWYYARDTRIVCPGSEDVMVIAPIQEEELDFSQCLGLFHPMSALHNISCAGGGSFGDVAYNHSPMFMGYLRLSRWGEWLILYLRNDVNYVLFGQGTQWDLASLSQPFMEQTGECGVSENPVEQVFEVAGLACEDPPTTAAVASWNTELGYWSEYLTLDVAIAAQDLDYFIDQSGRGHLLLLDSTSIWHYGPPLENAVTPTPAPVVAEYSLDAYPNPFNLTSTLSFSLPSAADIRIRIFDVTGREAKTVANERFSAGAHRITLNGESLASGVYFAVLEAGHLHLSRKLVYLK